MADELPAIEIDGDPRRFFVELDGMGAGHSGTWERREATLPDLCALVAALPDEAILEVAKAAGLFESGKRVAESAIRQMWRAQDAESVLASERAAHERTRAELAAALELVRDYESQWGGENLAHKWGLKERREAIENHKLPDEKP